MYYLLISFFVTLLFVFAGPAHAQMAVTPTVYCLGSCPTSPPAAGTTTSPAVTLDVTTTTSQTPSESISPSTGGTSPSPSPTVDPCVQDSSVTTAHNKHHRKNRGGFMEAFFKFLFKFFQMILEKMGIQLPNPGDGPNPTTTPEPSDAPEPTEEVTPTQSPCPQPTDETTQAPSPTTAASPTTAVSPTNAASPTTANPTVGLVSPTSNTSPNQLPGQILNLTNWELTLPTGANENPTDIYQPQLATYTNDPWFMPLNGNGVRFRSPVNGVTTSGSDYPRSELREMTNSGKDKANWTSSTGTHTMTIEEAITAVPKTKKHVVAGQIHDASSDVIVIRLEYPKLFVDIGGTDGPTLDANYTLGKKFSVKFEVTGGKTNVYYNNATTPAYTMSKSYSGAYFKAGAYTQSNCTKEASSDCNNNNYGEVVIYNVAVTHK